MRLNGLVASPSFAEWIQGEPLSIDSLLRAPDGRPRASIIYLSHLSESERVFGRVESASLQLYELDPWCEGCDPTGGALISEVDFASPADGQVEAQFIGTLVNHQYGAKLVLACEDDAGALHAAHKKYREIHERPRNHLPSDIQRDIAVLIPGILPECLMH